MRLKRLQSQKLLSAYQASGLGVVVITTTQLDSTKPELRFCTGANPVHGVLEIRDDEDLWQWSRQEKGLNAFLRSTIPQKQFIIVIRWQTDLPEAQPLKTYLLMTWACYITNAVSRNTKIFLYISCNSLFCIQWNLCTYLKKFVFHSYFFHFHFITWRC